MEDNNAAPQEPVQADQPVTEPTPTPVDDASQQPAPDQTQIQEEPQTQPEPSQTQTVQQPTIPYFPPQSPQIEPDEDGYIDPNKFYQAVMSDVESRMQFQEQEKRSWAQVEEKYPEIKQDPDLRDLVHSARLNDVTRGGAGDLTAAAEKVFGKLQSYQSKGKAQAQVSEKVQQSATLQTQTANTANQNSDANLIDRMSRGDETASEALISKWLADGKL